MEEAELKFKDFLSSQRLKYTLERQRIFKVIFDSREHFDAEGLYARLKNSSRPVSRSTVYRTLNLLVKLGLVGKVWVGNKSYMYQNMSHSEQHGYLVCVSCGKRQRFGISGIEKVFNKACKAFSFSAHNRTVQISGYCKDCKRTLDSNLRKKKQLLIKFER